ncbi:MAG: hypothetical protein R3236_03390 [Phycisphaeraceae bacterium]|nr:hypothetical protein [Phycisphaeraceae bacterium]
MDKLTWNDGSTPDALKQRAWKAFAQSGGYAALVAELMVLSKVVAEGRAEEELGQKKPQDGVPVEQKLDVRLQFKGKRFAVFAGDPSMDGDTTGSWAAAEIGGDLTQPQACKIADGLLDQVLDDWIRYGYRGDDNSDKKGPGRFKS